MKQTHSVSSDQATYEIRVRGKLDERWPNWFGGMTIAFEQADDGTAVTVLTAAATDQARLRGILSRLWDSNLTVLSVVHIETHEIHPNHDEAERK